MRRNRWRRWPGGGTNPRAQSAGSRRGSGCRSRSPLSCRRTPPPWFPWRKCRRCARCQTLNRDACAHPPGSTKSPAASCTATSGPTDGSMPMYGRGRHSSGRVRRVVVHRRDDPTVPDERRCHLIHSCPRERPLKLRCGDSLSQWSFKLPIQALATWYHFSFASIPRGCRANW